MEGRRLQEELKFNYWPRQVYDHSHRGDLIYGYEHSQEFSATEYGTCNANLAYYVVSGRLGDLYELLVITDLQFFTGIDLRRKLEDVLSGMFLYQFIEKVPRAA